MGRELRVFPRRTPATPVDDLVRIGAPELWDAADTVQVSCTCTWDIPRAEHLAGLWETVTKDVSLGGPALGDPGATFVPGRFLKRGRVITSRGCPNHCWFCMAWRREGNDMRLLPICDGYMVDDSNLLACPDAHVLAVFEMLARQKERCRFTGGLEARRLQGWHVEWLARLNPKTIWMAYDTPDDYEPLRQAARWLRQAGIMQGRPDAVCCYVLAGWNGARGVDTIEAAEHRVHQAVALGFFPKAMLFDDGREWPPRERRRWKDWAWGWSQKAMTGSKVTELLKGGGV